MQGAEPDQPASLTPFPDREVAAEPPSVFATEQSIGTADDVPPSADTNPQTQRRSRPVLWIGFTVAVVIVFGLVVAALNLGLYSPSGFVQRYLSALQRGDVGSALSMPGVDVPAGASTAALDPAALDPITRIDVRSDLADAAGTHTVTVDYRMGGATRSTAFVVTRDEPLFALFAGWRFAQTPVAAVQLRVQNSDSLSVDGVSVAASSVSAGSGSVVVAALAPSVLTIGADDRYFSATPVDVPITGTTGVPAATLALTASTIFVDAVQAELDDFLDGCATQQVLLPAGCPFGRPMEDRVLEPPTWTISTYPRISIDPAPDGSWSVPQTTGSAHISARVQSLFDGATTTLEEDVPFTVAYRITVDEAGVLTIAEA